MADVSLGLYTPTYPATPSVPTTYTVKVVGGVRVEAIPPRKASACNAARGVRGACSGLSEAAARRLRDCVMGLDQAAFAGGLVLTLTYPAPVTAFGAKSNLEAFFKRLQREYTGSSVGCIWRMELQPVRGVYHFHLLLLGLARLDKEWLSVIWAEVCARGGPIDPAQVRFGTRVDAVRPQGNAQLRLARYLSKADEIGPEEATGRVWGRMGAWKLYMAPVEELEVSPAQMVRVARTLDGLRRARARGRDWERGEAIRKSRTRRANYLDYKSRWYVDGRALVERWVEFGSRQSAIGNSEDPPPNA